jgi:hypothetical protein
MIVSVLQFAPPMITKQGNRKSQFSNIRFEISNLKSEIPIPQSEIRNPYFFT